MLAYFAEVWKIRQKEPPKFDLISMLAHGEATRDLPSRPQEFMEGARSLALVKLPCPP